MACHQMTSADFSTSQSIYDIVSDRRRATLLHLFEYGSLMRYDNVAIGAHAERQTTKAVSTQARHQPSLITLALLNVR